MLPLRSLLDLQQPSPRRHHLLVGALGRRIRHLPQPPHPQLRLTMEAHQVSTQNPTQLSKIPKTVCLTLKKNSPSRRNRRRRSGRHRRHRHFRRCHALPTPKEEAQEGRQRSRSCNRCRRRDRSQRTRRSRQHCCAQPSVSATAPAPAATGERRSRAVLRPEGRRGLVCSRPAVPA